MTAEPLELIGMLGLCGAGALALGHPDGRVRHAAMLVALVVAPVLVLGDVWDDHRVVSLRDRPATVAAALLLGAVAVGGLAVLFRRVRWAFPLAAFITLPLRAPVEVTGQTANLLVPLYLVIAAGVVASAWGSLVTRRSSPGSVTDGGAVAERPLVRALRWILAAVLILYAVQSSYSEDVSNAIENAGFFLVPFAVLFALLFEVRWDRRLLGALLVAATAVAAVFALVAFWQYAARDLFLNDELLASNQIHQYFRVNSLFYDPNIFGRYLAITLVALGAYLAWSREGNWAWPAAVASLPILAALALSFSITSLICLLAGLGIVALLRFGLRWAIVGVAVALVAGGLFIAVGGAQRSDVGPDRTLGDETSGRTDLFTGGVELAEDRPLGGWGSGSFGAAFFSQIQPVESTSSHAEPITVAAEQGAVGLIVYLALVGVSLALLFGAGSGGLPRSDPARAAVAACYVAMVVHSIGYAGFLTDPATWALLALGAALTPRPAPATAQARAPAPRGARLRPATTPPKAPAGP